MKKQRKDTSQKKTAQTAAKRNCATIRRTAQTAWDQGDFQTVVEAYSSWSAALNRSARDWFIEGDAWLKISEPAKAYHCLKQAYEIAKSDLVTVQVFAKTAFLVGEFTTAQTLLRQLMANDPDRFEYVQNLILVLREVGEREQAIAECAKAIDRWPSKVEPVIELARLYQEQEAWFDAAKAYRQAIKLAPERLDLHPRLIKVLQQSNDREQIMEAFENWRTVEPTNEVAKHLLAGYRAEEIPSRASDEYVRDVFDRFASTFEASLADLSYEAPQRIGKLIANDLKAMNKPIKLLDAGCGTGLMAVHVKSLVDQMIGVDLSSQMIEIARAKNLYDDLVCEELTHFLLRNVNSFDVLVSADTLNYFGLLGDVLQAAHDCLMHDGGLLVFTLEAHATTSADSKYEIKDFTLHKTGRYSHSQEYVQRQLNEVGFAEIRHEEIVIRTEAETEVKGWIWIASKHRKNEIARV